MLVEGQEDGKRTMREIAEELGVSLTTVSRSLSGKGRIAPETRARVLACANRLGRETAGTARPRTGTLILVVPPTFVRTDMPYLRGCMGGVCRMAAQRNYRVLLCFADASSPGDLERQLEEGRSDGVLLTRPTRGDPCLDLVRQAGLPFAALGRLEREGGVQADFDHAAAGQEMTDLLLRLGLRRIAYLGGSSLHTVNRDRLEGYRRGLEKGGAAAEEGLVRTGVETPEQMVDALDRILDAGPECLLCGDDALAVSALRELCLRKIPVPRKLKMASLCDSPLLENMVPGISAVRFDAAALGAGACRMLLDTLAGREAEARQLPHYQVILRESTR